MAIHHTHPAQGQAVRSRTLVPFGLTYTESLEILVACTPFRPGCVPPWLFREILVRGLASDSPRLAFKIGMLDDDQMESIYQFIEAAHALTEHPDAEEEPSVEVD